MTYRDSAALRSFMLHYGVLRWILMFVSAHAHTHMDNNTHPLHGQLSDSEPIHIWPTIHHIVAGSDPSDYPEEIALRFSVFGRDFELQLKKNVDLTTQEYRDLHYFEDCHYTGHIRGEPFGLAAVSTCGGRIAGTVLSKRHTFSISPPPPLLPSERKQDGSHRRLQTSNNYAWPLYTTTTTLSSPRINPTTLLGTPMTTAAFNTAPLISSNGVSFLGNNFPNLISSTSPGLSTLSGAPLGASFGTSIGNSFATSLLSPPISTQTLYTPTPPITSPPAYGFAPFSYLYTSTDSELEAAPQSLLLRRAALDDSTTPYDPTVPLFYSIPSPTPSPLAAAPMGPQRPPTRTLAPQSPTLSPVTLPSPTTLVPATTASPTTRVRASLSPTTLSPTATRLPITTPKPTARKKAPATTPKPVVEVRAASTTKPPTRKPTVPPTKGTTQTLPAHTVAAVEAPLVCGVSPGSLLGAPFPFNPSNSSRRDPNGEDGPFAATGFGPSNPLWIEVMAFSDNARMNDVGSSSFVGTVDLMNQVDLFYRAGHFTPPLRIKVVGEEKWTQSNRIQYPVDSSGAVDPSGLLDNFVGYRRLHQNDWPTHDVAVLLSESPFTGSISGLSGMYTMCSGASSASIVRLSFSASVTLNAALIAHEFGHTLGAAHDNVPPNSDCGSGYIMSATIGTNTLIGLNPGLKPSTAPASRPTTQSVARPNLWWSTCTQKNIIDFFLQYHPTCLSFQPSTGGNTAPVDVCGDGVRGPTEQCDCGFADCSVYDPCCDGNSCRFVPGAVCSTTDETPCCLNCQFIPASPQVLCRVDDAQCAVPQYCTGWSAWCPPLTFSPTGQACSTSTSQGLIPGMCYQGECRSTYVNCQNAGYSTPCRNPFGNSVQQSLGIYSADPCASAWCVMNNQCGMLRSPVAGYSSTSAYQPYPLDDGTPCTSNDGSTDSQQCFQGRCTLSSLIPTYFLPFEAEGLVAQNLDVTPTAQSVSGNSGSPCSNLNCGPTGVCSSGVCWCANGYKGTSCDSSQASVMTAPTAKAIPTPKAVLKVTTRPPTSSPTKQLGPLGSVDPILAVAVVGQPFFLSFKSYFVPPLAPANYKLAFSETGLASTSGLEFDGVAGAIFGTPNTGDATQSLLGNIELGTQWPPDVLNRSLKVVVTAVDQQGRSARQTVRIAVFSTTSPLSPQGTFAPVVAIQGRSISIDTTPYFASQSNSLTYSVLGLPRGTGLQINPTTGLLSGTPTTADSSAASTTPLTVHIIASDGKSTAEQTFQLSVMQSGKAPLVLSPGMPVTASISSNFQFNVAAFFKSADGSSLKYSVQGLPPGTGLTVDPQSGILSGFPSLTDLAVSQPIQVTVVAASGFDNTRTSQITLPITVTSGGNQQAVSTSVSNPTSSPGNPIKQRTPPASSARVGEFYRFPFANYLLSTGPLQFQILGGLPKGTGLTLDPASGALSGVPTAQDAATAQPLLVRVAATDTAQNQAFVTLSLTVVGGALAVQPTIPIPNTMAVTVPTPAGISSQGPLAVVPRPASAVVGLPFVLRLSDYLKNPSAIVVYTLISGLPSGSGLTFDSVNGVLSGTPNVADLMASQPLSVRVRIADSTGANNDVILSITVVAPPAPTPAPIAPYSLQQAATVSQPDLTTAVTSDPIPDQTVLVGQPWYLDLSSRFHGYPLTYSQVGLPLLSGIRLDPVKGVLYGTPVDADAAQTQPMVVRITASNGKGGSSAQTLLITVAGGSALTCTQLGASTSTSSAISLSMRQAGCPVAAPTPSDCTRLVNFATAKTLCQNAGARLCTSDEIFGGSFKDIGQCSVLLTSRVWTSSLCADGRPLTHAGSSDNIAQFVPQCTAPTTQLHTPCCADSRSAGTTTPATQQTARVVTEVTVPRVSVSAQVGTSMSAVLFSLAVQQRPELAGDIATGYQLLGLPTGSGLRLDTASGLLVGTPNQIDAAYPQPINLTVTIQSAGLTQHLTVLPISVRVLPLVNNPTVVASTQAGYTQALEGSPFQLETAPFFKAPPGESLTFSIAQGLPAGTGFGLNPISGQLFGTPVDADAYAPQPLNLMIVATSTSGGKASFTVRISVTPHHNPQPTGATISTMSGQVSTPFYFDFSQKCMSPDGLPLTWSTTSLSPGTGLALSTTGVLFGTPSQSDVSTKILQVTATDQLGGTCQYILVLDIAGASTQPPTAFSGLRSGASVPTPPPTSSPTNLGINTGSSLFNIVTISPGKPVFYLLNIPGGDQCGGSVICSCSGLPSQSGLTFDSGAGVLMGVPTAAWSAGLAAGPVWIIISLLDTVTFIASTLYLAFLPTGGDKPSIAATSQESCAELGWDNLPTLASLQPLSSTAGPPSRPGSCSSGVVGYSCASELTWRQAALACASLEARLCTVEELANLPSLTTGDGGCSKPMWTFTQCPSSTSTPSPLMLSLDVGAVGVAISSGFSTSSPAAANIPLPRCVSTSTTLPFQCCADAS